MSAYRVTASTTISHDSQKVLDEGEIHKIVDQCIADAVEGSFTEFPPYWKDDITLRAERRGVIEIKPPEGKATVVEFTFDLPSELFPVENGALQHLTGMLAGDLFPTRVGGAVLSNTEVLNLEVPPDIRQEFLARFRSDHANSIESIREQFKLQHDEPLLAFTFKPRVGVPFERIRQVSLEVLKEGFHIVELDTRNLEVNKSNLAKWIELGKEAAGIAGHVTAFSPNFSMPSHQAMQLIEPYVAALPESHPAVIKIDGGLEGLGTLQALRQSSVFANRRPPIVTCYPLLRRQLEAALSRDKWVEFLALSGVDIIYPGGRPSFPMEPRPIWSAEQDRLRQAAEHYDRLIKQGWPMPTVAGGIGPGQLQAFYELLGPNAAYFLGGAVSLHQESPRAGAELCVKVMRKTRRRTRSAIRRGSTHARDLPARVVAGIEKAGKGNIYYSPANIFKSKDTSSPPPKPFYRRSTS